jgi:hypothetical protein
MTTGRYAIAMKPNNEWVDHRKYSGGWSRHDNKKSDSLVTLVEPAGMGGGSPQERFSAVSDVKHFV